MAQRPVHKLVDRWFSTLAGTVNDSTTTWTVATGHGALLVDPSAVVDTIIHCQAEKVRVTAISTDTLTVERGYGGTTAATHTAGAPVAQCPYEDVFNDMAERIAALERFLAAMYGQDGVAQDGGTQVIADDPPSMTVVITAGSAIVSGQVVRIAEDVEIEFTAPVTDPRIDIVQVNQFGAVSAKLGTEAGSPSKPSPDTGNAELAEVHHTTAETHIDDADGGDGYIVPTQVYI